MLENIPNRYQEELLFEVSPLICQTVTPGVPGHHLSPFLTTQVAQLMRGLLDRLNELKQSNCN